MRYSETKKYCTILDILPHLTCCDICVPQETKGLIKGACFNIEGMKGCYEYLYK